MKVQRDAALDRVGRMLYGRYWLGTVPRKEWQLAQDADGQQLPEGAKEASRILVAQHWRDAGRAQMGRVIDWWAAHGGETVAKFFDQPEFERLFRAVFGVTTGEADTTRRRKDSVARILANHRPGRGGDVTWKEFVRFVNRDCSSSWDESTIKRDVAETTPQKRRTVHSGHR